MSTNTPPFNEKEFLLGLLSIIEGEHGKELRFIMDHKFDSIDTSIPNYIPTLKKLSSDNSIKKFIMQWFKEAETRKLVSFVKPQYYQFTELGYNQAAIKKSPVTSFCKREYKWLIPVCLSFALGVVAILRYIQCK